MSTEKIRLLYLVFNRTGRGTYWRALGFAQQLALRGFEVTLLAASPEPREGTESRDVKGVKLVQFPDLHRGSGYDPWHLFQRLRWVRKHPCDLVHAFEARPVNIGPALYLQRRRKVPLVLDWCDWFGRGGSVEERPNPWLRTVLRPVETFFEERFRRLANGSTVINSVLEQKALALGVDPGELLILPNGANVEEIRPQPLDKLRERLCLSPERQYLAYTGGIFERDAELMAAAFDLIHAARPDVHLLLIGYCDIAVEEMVQAPEAVLRTGQVTLRALADYVAASDVGWLPLRDRGANRGRFPMKAHDFMAAGRPLLVTDVGDLGDLVRQKKIGRVAADEPGALAEAALELLANDEARNEMGRRARHVAMEDYAWEVVTDRLEAFYHRLLHSSAAAPGNHKGPRVRNTG